MRTKLTLNLEDLFVESFDTTSPQSGKGTVFAEQGPCTCPTACTCPGCLTCDYTACGQQSCAGSCESCESCWETCQVTCPETCTPECEAYSRKYTNCNNICY